MRRFINNNRDHKALGENKAPWQLLYVKSGQAVRRLIKSVVMNILSLAHKHITT